MFTIGQYKEDMARGCNSLAFWVLLSGNISQLMMVVNSSINFFIYCVMSAIFREVFCDMMVTYCPMMKDNSLLAGLFPCCKARRRGRNSLEMQETKVIAMQGSKIKPEGSINKGAEHQHAQHV